VLILYKILFELLDHDDDDTAFLVALQVFVLANLPNAKCAHCIGYRNDFNILRKRIVDSSFVDRTISCMWLTCSGSLWVFARISSYFQVALSSTPSNSRVPSGSAF
jgi:hypothetical protein